MQKVFRWIPAFLVMSVIFFFSTQPSPALPDFGWADRLMKKGGHMAGYGSLALSFWYALEWKNEKRWLTWLLAIFYAATDEFHQWYVPGRHPSVWDVMIFDNLGALIALWLAGIFLKRKRPGVNP